MLETKTLEQTYGLYHHEALKIQSDQHLGDWDQKLTDARSWSVPLGLLRKYVMSSFSVVEANCCLVRTGGLTLGALKIQAQAILSEAVAKISLALRLCFVDLSLMHTKIPKSCLPWRVPEAHRQLVGPAGLTRRSLQAEIETHLMSNHTQKKDKQTKKILYKHST